MSDEANVTTEVDDDEEYGLVSSKDDMPFIMPMEEFAELPEGGVETPPPLVKFTVFNNETGRITQFGDCAEGEWEYQDQDEPHLTVILGAFHFDDYYVDLATGTPELKREFEYSLRQSDLTLVIEGLPAGTKITVEGDSLETDDEDTEIDFDVPGVYRIALSGQVSHHNADFEVTIDG